MLVGVFVLGHGLAAVRVPVDSHSWEYSYLVTGALDRAWVSARRNTTGG